MALYIVESSNNVNGSTYIGTPEHADSAKSHLKKYYINNIEIKEDQDYPEMAYALDNKRYLIATAYRDDLNPKQLIDSLIKNNKIKIDKEIFKIR